MPYLKGSNFVLELNIKEQEEENWQAFTRGVQNYGEALSDSTQDYYYMDGKGTSETEIEGTIKTFTVSGHRHIPDKVQDYLFKYEMQYNTKSGIRNIPYRYYNTIDGVGEEGIVTVSYSTTGSGEAKTRAVIGLVLSVNGMPSKYTKIKTSLTITYDPNEGTGTVVDETKYEAGRRVTIKGAEDLEHTTKKFVSWNTKADGTGTKYLPQDALIISENVTLYAQWE